MKHAVCYFIMIMFLLPAAATAGGEGFKIYPGAAADLKAAEAASNVQSGTKVGVYTTGDSFEKVVAFYKGIYREYKFPSNPPNVPNQKVMWAFFLIDGGKDLQDSKHWMKIQRPYIGSTKIEGLAISYSDIRDVTVIEVVQKSGDIK